MKKETTRTRLATMALVGGLAVGWGTTRAQALNQLTPAETAAGWKLLFDGKTESGWIRPDGSKGRFVFEDSALKTKDGDICTPDEYQDFDLSIDYKYNVGGNSGIFLRTKRGIDPPWLSGMEVAIQDNGRKANLYKNGDAAIYDVVAPSKDMWTGPGIWNHLVIHLQGSKLTHTHNGTKVIDVDMSTPQWKTMVAASKYVDAPFPENNWGKETKGQICLQDHGDPMLAWFRNIKVLKLDGSTGTGSGATNTQVPVWHCLAAPGGAELRWDFPLLHGITIEIAALDGSLIRSGSIARGGTRFALPGLAPGLYVARLIDAGGRSRGLIRAL